MVSLCAPWSWRKLDAEGDADVVAVVVVVFVVISLVVLIAPMNRRSMRPVSSWPELVTHFLAYFQNVFDLCSEKRDVCF